jgi:hypothetical protein
MARLTSAKIPALIHSFDSCNNLRSDREQKRLRKLSGFRRCFEQPPSQTQTNVARYDWKLLRAAAQ